MRTTVDIPDPLYRELKSRAAHQGKSVKDLILRSLRAELDNGDKPTSARASLPIVKSSRPGTLQIDNAQIFDVIPFP